MNRRDFMKAGAAAGLALPLLNAHVAGAQDQKPIRAGLIGSGWYGKCDILRLIQVAPVEMLEPVVEAETVLPDPDLVAEAAALLGKAERPLIFVGSGAIEAGERKLASVHPDYLQELFGQRLGMQIGAKRSAINSEGDQQDKVEAVFKLEQIQQIDAELPSIRGSRTIVSTGQPFSFQPS